MGCPASVQGESRTPWNIVGVGGSAWTSWPEWAMNAGRSASVPAHVVRVTPEGIGVEWNEFNPPAVAQLLHSRLELQGAIDSTIGIRNGASAL